MYHHRSFRRGLSALASGFVALAADPGAVALADEESRFTEAARLRWKPCGDSYPDVECAVASVPLDYDEPDGETISLQLARFAGTNAKATLFVNPGGPGGSGVDLVLNGFGRFMAELSGGQLDIVGFDPRGVASSEPLFCFDSEEEAFELLGQGPAFPYLVDQESTFFELYSSVSEHCGNPRIREHMSTADVVRDLDRLRALVGDERLNYLGFSYGSYIGATYANLFPEKVGRLAIDGVLDPVLWSTGMQIVSDRVATEAELEELLRLCDEAGSDCALSGGDGGAGARYDVVESALLDAPLELADGELFYDTFVLYTRGAMYAPEYDWGGPEGFGSWIAALYDTVLGEAGAAERASAILSAIDARWASPPPFAGFDNGFDAFIGNHCSDADYPDPFEDFSNTGIYAQRESAFGALWWWDFTPCARWPLAQDRYAGPWTAETAAPVLVVGNYFDGVTDYGSAVSTSELLPNSRLLSYAGWGHGAFGVSQCATEHIVSYLVDGVLPPEGTVCEANANPFIPSVTEPEAASEPDAFDAPRSGLLTWRVGQRPRSLAQRLRH